MSLKNRKIIKEFPLEIREIRDICNFLFIISACGDVYYRKGTALQKLENSKNVLCIQQFLKEFFVILEFSSLKIYKCKGEVVLEKVFSISSRKFSSDNILEPATVLVKDFTIFVVCKDSRVFFCNFVPKRFTFSLKQALKIEKSVASNYWTMEVIKEIKGKILEILKQENLILNSSVEISLSNRIFREISNRQGKFKEIMHFKQQDLSEVSEISDFFLQNSEKSQNMMLFFKCWRNGMVQIFVQLEPVEIIGGDDVKWILLEEISLFPNENLDMQVKITQDLKYSTVLYLYHDYGVHRLDFLEWEKVLLNSDVSLESLSVVSTLEWVMTTFDKALDPVKEFRVFSDFENGYSYTVFTESGREFHDLLPIRPLLNLDQKKNVQLPKHTPEQKKSFKIPELRQLGPSGFKGSGKYPDGVSEGLLTDFTKEIVCLRDHLTQILQAGVVLQSRLQFILGEQKEAKRILSDASAFVSADSNQELDKRLEAIRTRQKKLEAKSTIILQILLDQTQPDLNMAEKQWFSDLTKLAASIKKKMHLAIDDIRSQKDLMCAQFSLPTTSTSLGLSQTHRIQESLGIEYDLIAQATKKAQELSDRLGG